MVGVVTAAVALVAGYLLGRLRPGQRLGDWAADQVRHAGTRVQGGAGRQAVVVLAHSVTTPRISRRIMHVAANETQAHQGVRRMRVAEGPHPHRMRGPQPVSGPSVGSRSESRFARESCARAAARWRKPHTPTRLL
jgi:hypothetical protein